MEALVARIKAEKDLLKNSAKTRQELSIHNQRYGNINSIESIRENSYRRYAPRKRLDPEDPRTRLSSPAIAFYVGGYINGENPADWKDFLVKLEREIFKFKDCSDGASLKKLEELKKELDCLKRQMGSVDKVEWRSRCRDFKNRVEAGVKVVKSAIEENERRAKVRLAWENRTVEQVIADNEAAAHQTRLCLQARMREEMEIREEMLAKIKASKKHGFWCRIKCRFCK